MTPDAWNFPDPGRAPAGVELLAVSSTFTADMALQGYRSGLFAMELDRPDLMGWYSPDPRGVLPLTGLHVSRSLRRSMRRFRMTCDTAFEAVVVGCADPTRPGGWITPRYRQVYAELHTRGIAHSVEVWSGDRLVGGVFGVELGGLFCGESMFHRETDASKAAVVGLVQRLTDAEDPASRVLDVQWSTPHLASLGVIEMPRTEYLARIRAAVRLPAAF